MSKKIPLAAVLRINCRETSGEAAGGGQVKDDGGSEQDSDSKEGAKCQGLNIFSRWSPKDFLTGAD